MKVIIAGSRQFVDYKLLKENVDEFREEHEIDTIISGTARGADTLGEEYARLHNIDVIKMPANWREYGKRAGYLRNEQMAEVADACICFWDGDSRGTKHMIDIARRMNLILKVVIYK
jgi:hypothetical protein